MAELLIKFDPTSQGWLSYHLQALSAVHLPDRLSIFQGFREEFWREILKTIFEKLEKSEKNGSKLEENPF